MRKSFHSIFLFAGLTAPAMAQDLVFPQFHDVTTTSGLNSVYKGEWQYMVGGGVASFDCNDDHMPDVFIAGGENPSKFFVNKSAPNGNLVFEEVTSGTEIANATGAYAIDIDGDGQMDLVVLRVGENKVYKGLGHCRFKEANELYSMSTGDSWGTAFSATFEKGNRFPTFAFGSYIDRAFKDEPWGHCGDNWLLRPNASQNGFGAKIPLSPSYCALSMLFTDWNHSGNASLRVANDREYYEGGEEQLWKVIPGSPPVLYTRQDGWKYFRFWGMGIASADLNADGQSEMFVTSMADQRLQFLANGNQSPTYKDAPYAMGAKAQKPYAGGDTRPSTGWHAQFEDINNDGFYDLFVSKGNVDVMPDFAQKDPSNLLLQKPDGNFIEAGEKANMLNFDQARGAIVDDFNLDGRMDVLIVNRHTNVRLFQNISPALQHWLGVRLFMNGPNRDGIGALIEVKIGDRIMRREVTVGGGHMSSTNGFWHFGLADKNEAEMRVEWPGGEFSDWTKVAADKFYFISQAGTRLELQRVR